MRLGEAFSKCQHLLGTPLMPKVAAELAAIYLAKGVAATTAIEGNSLTEDEVRDVLAGKKALPAALNYLAVEVKNVEKLLGDIHASARQGERFVLTPQWLMAANRQILADISVAEHVRPGVFTTDQLRVGGYKTAPPQDVPYLVDRLCEWINSRLDEAESLPDDFAFVNAVITAILAHLYLVWIHPFGDGNGRTARALECAIMERAGVPWISANLLSDFYNRTRSQYYARLNAASADNDVHGFIEYAVTGFVALLREQISHVQKMQRSVAWTNYVHQVFQSQPSSEAAKRRRALVLALPERGAERGSLRHLTPQVAEMYSGKATNTLTQDLNKLSELGLVTQTSRGHYRPALGIISAFLPDAAHRP